MTKAYEYTMYRYEQKNAPLRSLGCFSFVILPKCQHARPAYEQLFNTPAFQTSFLLYIFSPLLDIPLATIHFGRIILLNILFLRFSLLANLKNYEVGGHRSKIFATRSRALLRQNMGVEI